MISSAPDFMVGLFRPAAIQINVVDAQTQARTPRDVKGPWLRPVCMSKRNGRRGSRRAWKRANPPHRVWLYREPTDVLMIDRPIVRQPLIIATPRQYEELKREGVAS